MDYDLAMEVIDFFQLNEKSAVEIKNKVLASDSNWNNIAKSIGLSRAEQQKVTARPN